jgi:hypothetical protein
MPRTITGQTEADRQPISLRLRPGLRDRVWATATIEGKSLNAIVNDLIERGLTRPDDMFGSLNGYNVARALLAAAEAAVTKYGAEQGLWLYDPENFDRAAAAMRQMLETLRPVPEAQEALAEIEEARKRHLHLVKGGSNG